MWLITCGDHPELLLRPLGCGMLRHIPMHDASRPYVQHHEDVQQAKSYGDGNEEITASTARAWFRIKIVQRCDVRRVPVPFGGGMYRLTVRGDTRMPTFRRSSAAIRSSPQVRLARAMSPISWRKSAGNRGRP